MSGPATRLVGRLREQEVLSTLVAAAREGRFGAVVLEGDAGIGKTSLVRSACEVAGEGTLVLAGTCLPLTSVAVPLMGLRSAVRALPVGERPGVLGGHHDPGAGTHTPLPVAFDDWLAEHASRHPVLLALDDLHWADEETLDALMYVLAGPADRALALLLTVRSSEVGPTHPLRPWLADVKRLPGVTALTLGPLTRDEVAVEVAAVMGEEAHSSLVDAVVERSRGNPYFVRLLLAGVPPSAETLPRQLPEQLSAAVVRPWDDLSPEAQRLLVALAVGGRPAVGPALDRVADVADLPDPGPALREALGAGMLEVGDSGAYWFRHPLQAEVLEQGLLPQSRRVLHAGFAAGYEEDLGAGPPSGELAETISDHHALAGQLDRAYEWALVAADAMRRTGDLVGVARMLRRAVDLHAEVPDAREPLDGLLDDLRRAARDLGDWEEELAAVEALRDIVDPDEEPLRLAVLDAWRGMLRFRLGLGEQVEDLVRAVELSAGHPGTWERVVVLCDYSRMLLWAGDVDAGRAAVEAARRSVEEPADDPAPDADEWARARAYLYGQRLMLATFDGDPSEAGELGRLAVEAAAPVRDGATILHATFWEANAVSDPGREWAAVVDRGRRLLEDIGAPHRFVAWLSAGVAQFVWLFGDLTLATERLRVALGADAGRAGNYIARLTAAMIAACQGRQDEADAHLARAEELVDDPLSYPNFPAGAATAMVLLHRGDRAGAVDIAERAIRAPGAEPTMCEWLAPLAARGLADLVRADLDAGRDPSAHRDRLAALREEVPEVLQDLGLRAPRYLRQVAAQQALYDAEVARAGLGGDELAAWRDAATLLREAGLAWDEAYACWRAAEAALTVGGAAQRRDAALLLRRGHEVALRLGAEPVRESIEALARSARVRLDVVREPEGAGAPAGSADGVSLTPREREVLEHVVAGRTYPEIAEALVVSEKTVSSHISNLLRKTGTANRVELASWAARRDGAR